MTYDPTDKPAFHRMPDVESAATAVSTWSTPPKKKSAPAKIRTMIGKLGLRFDPSSKADLDAHAARVALLAEDIADADAWKLEQAIDRWVATKPFLPKASDLRGLIADIEAPKGSGQLVNLAERYNVGLEARGSKLRWRYRDPTNLESELYLTDTTPLVNKFADPA